VEVGRGVAVGRGVEVERGVARGTVVIDGGGVGAGRTVARGVLEGRTVARGVLDGRVVKVSRIPGVRAVDVAVARGVARKAGVAVGRGVEVGRGVGVCVGVVARVGVGSVSAFDVLDDEGRSPSVDVLVRNGSTVAGGVGTGVEDGAVALVSVGTDSSSASLASAPRSAVSLGAVPRRSAIPSTTSTPLRSLWTPVAGMATSSGLGSTNSSDRRLNGLADSRVTSLTGSGVKSMDSGAERSRIGGASGAAVGRAVGTGDQPSLGCETGSMMVGESLLPTNRRPSSNSGRRMAAATSRRGQTVAPVQALAVSVVSSSNGNSSTTGVGLFGTGGTSGVSGASHSGTTGAVRWDFLALANSSSICASGATSLVGVFISSRTDRVVETWARRSVPTVLMSSVPSSS